MRFAIFSFLLALLATYAVAIAPLKAVIVSYPSDTPNEVVENAKDAIKQAVRL
jgi:Mrp family chromosome partitioning ATPase